MITKITTGERLGIIETKISNIEKATDSIKKSLDNLDKIYARKDEVSNLKRAFYITLSALGAVAVLLLNYLLGSSPVFT